MPQTRAAHGFTLVEVLVVVAIISILAAVVVPRIGTTAPAQLSAAARLLSADLAYAQSESIANTDDPRIVVFDLDNNRYHIARSSDPDTPITDPITKQPYQVTFGQGRARHLGGVTLHGYALGDDDRVRFGAYGQVTDQTTPARVTLAAGGNMKIIMISMDQNSGEQSISDVVDADSDQGKTYNTRLNEVTSLLTITQEIGTAVTDPIDGIDDKLKLNLLANDEDDQRGLINLSGLLGGGGEGEED